MTPEDNRLYREKNVRAKTPHQVRVEELMAKAGQALPDHPIMPGLEVRRLRANLILEEALETIRGLGFSVMDKLQLEECQDPSIVEIVDGCADISVVSIGTLSAMGVADDRILEIVDENNLAKFGPGSYKREDGKWMKPPDHKPPDVLGELILQGYGDKYFGRPPHDSAGFRP